MALSKLTTRGKLLLAVSVIALASAIYTTARPVYGYYQSSSDGGTSYWQPSDGPCDTRQSQTKRPIKTSYTASEFYLNSILGSSETSHRSADTTGWLSREGNCPYQINDIYKLRVPLDLYAVSIVTAIAAFVTPTRRRS